MQFEQLGLSEDILKAIADCGYDEPTPIQAQAIPNILMARDLVGLAQTGTGKTASFTLPMIEILQGGRAKARMPRSLILTPTRELAAQVAENFDTYGKYTGLSKALLTGGVSMDEQIKLLDRGVDVLIATPGRLLDLFERGRILLNDIKILVIDEADRMLDMGFIPDIEKIIGLLPFTRQTLLFSATMPKEIRKLSQNYLSNPKEVSVSAPATTAKNVEQFVVHVHPKDKRHTLEKIIRSEDVTAAFIFCNRKRDIDDLVRWLKGKGYKAQGLHGDMAQKNRTETLEAFKNDEITLLVCSDVAGRGIDVDDLSHVFNFDVPMNADDYVHRIGRTGRAGKTGRAWMLATRNEDKYLDAIQKLTKQKITVKDVDEAKSKKDDGKSSQKDKSKDKPQDKSKDKASDKKSDNPSDKSQSKPKSERKSAPKKDNNKKKNKGDGDGDVKGFGDEMPNFFGS
ncbi:MAG: DEAD/DEAH box helicase [Alphaproteobacteria bacterium]|nr:DEAD/DEAH box helicase [Alphaproteobacteria bacterium]